MIPRVARIVALFRRIFRENPRSSADVGNRADSLADGDNIRQPV